MAKANSVSCVILSVGPSAATHHLGGVLHCSAKNTTSMVYTVDARHREKIDRSSVSLVHHSADRHLRHHHHHRPHYHLEEFAVPITGFQYDKRITSSTPKSAVLRHLHPSTWKAPLVVPAPHQKWPPPPGKAALRHPHQARTSKATLETQRDRTPIFPTDMRHTRARSPLQKCLNQEAIENNQRLPRKTERRLQTLSSSRTLMLKHTLGLPTYSPFPTRTQPPLQPNRAFNSRRRLHTNDFLVLVITSSFAEVSFPTWPTP